MRASPAPIALALLPLLTLACGALAPTKAADTDTDAAVTDDTDVQDDTDTDAAVTDDTDVPGDTDAEVPGDSDTDVPADTDVAPTCPALPLEQNPYACALADPSSDCTQAPTLQGWIDAACAHLAQFPSACLPPRVTCTLPDARTATVILHDVDDVSSWPVYDAAGAHVATFVRSDTDEFCGPSNEAWFGDAAYAPCRGVMDVWFDGCDTDLPCP